MVTSLPEWLISYICSLECSPRGSRFDLTTQVVEVFREQVGEAMSLSFFSVKSRPSDVLALGVSSSQIHGQAAKFGASHARIFLVESRRIEVATFVEA